ncbi:uracil-DNA glycosylase [Aequorivita sp. Q41]|uniref:uracil-DNA glycosylase n=1 Tax=Aequorivita sp. Q41 TaxID=3153300 RepID=UPI00324233EB
MQLTIPSSWKQVLKEEIEKPAFKNLMKFVENEYNSPTSKCFPPSEQLFSAFAHTPFNEVKVVLIGQDPYHGAGQANGLCFSVNDGIKKPPSLNNIFKKISLDLGTEIPESGNLERWANQGVLLLNAILSVREKKPGSHKNKGWEKFTDAVIEKLASEKENLVFILWGNYAKQKGKNIDDKKHLVIKSIHPSPLSVNKNREEWFSNNNFNEINNFLREKGKLPIEW